MLDIGGLDAPPPENSRDLTPRQAGGCLVLLVVVALLVLFFTACATEPSTDTPISPLPAEYRVWWAETEACTGRHGDFNRVHWFETDLVSDGKNGHISDDRRTIWLDHTMVGNRRVVSHEAFHAMGGSFDHHEPEWRQCDLWG